MNRCFVIVGSLVVAIALASLSQADNKGAAPVSNNHAIRMKDGNKYDPPMIEVKVGDTITWLNDSGAKHTATSDDVDKTFDTKTVNAGEFSKAVIFKKEGEIPYHCTIHGQGMSGKVKVVK